MTLEEETIALHKVLSTPALSSEEKVDAMIALGKLCMTIAVLRSTKIGRLVASMAKDKGEPYAELAHQTELGWRKLASAATTPAPDSSRVSSRPKAAVVSYKEPSEKEMEEAAHAKSAKEIASKDNVKVSAKREPLPKRNATTRVFHFTDYPEFQPNMSPEEVLAAGSFGGTYFRPIKSRVTGKTYGKEVVDELQQWVEKPFTEAEIKRKIASPVYNVDVNTYKAKCGASLDEWESSGWMRDCDPYGWFQWYCRFFQGRRCDDDDRQVQRWTACAGTRGRWKTNLMNKILAGRVGSKTLEQSLNDHKISPVVRQTLQHWAKRIGLEELTKFAQTK